MTKLDRGQISICIIIIEFYQRRLDGITTSGMPGQYYKRDEI